MASVLVLYRVASSEFTELKHSDLEYFIKPIWAKTLYFPSKAKEQILEILKQNIGFDHLTI